MACPSVGRSAFDEFQTTERVAVAETGAWVVQGWVVVTTREGRMVTVVRVVDVGRAVRAVVTAVVAVVMGDVAVRVRRVVRATVLARVRMEEGGVTAVDCTRQIAACHPIEAADPPREDAARRE